MASVSHLQQQYGKPIFLRGGKVGILLVHGFTSTPYVFRELSHKLHKKGFTVSAPTIAGHGTTPEDLELTTRKDWYRSIEEAFDDLEKQCESILVLGASFGANLACHLAAHRKIDGLILIGIPRWIHKHTLIEVGIVAYRLLGKRFFDKAIRKTTDDGFIFAGPTHSYIRIPIKSLQEMMHILAYDTERNLIKISAPTLIIQSIHDGLVKPVSGRFVFNHIKSKNKQLIWISEAHHELHTGKYRRLIYSFISDFMLSWI